RALSDLQPTDLRGLFPVARLPRDLFGGPRLAPTIHRLHQEVCAGGIRFDEVVRSCGPDLLFDDSERWRILARTQDGYRTELARLGLADRGLARIEALHSGRIESENPLWLIGVSEMPPVLQAMLRAAAAGAMPIHALIQAGEED